MLVQVKIWSWENRTTCKLRSNRTVKALHPVVAFTKEVDRLILDGTISNRSEITDVELSVTEEPSEEE